MYSVGFSGTSQAVLCRSTLSLVEFTAQSRPARRAEASRHDMLGQGGSGRWEGGSGWDEGRM